MGIIMRNPWFQKLIQPINDFEIINQWLRLIYNYIH